MNKIQVINWREWHILRVRFIPKDWGLYCFLWFSVFIGLWEIRVWHSEKIQASLIKALTRTPEPLSEGP